MQIPMEVDVRSGPNGGEYSTIIHANGTVETAYFPREGSAIIEVAGIGRIIAENIARIEKRLEAGE